MTDIHELTSLKAKKLREDYSKDIITPDELMEGLAELLNRNFNFKGEPALKIITQMFLATGEIEKRDGKYYSNGFREFENGDDALNFLGQMGEAGIINYSEGNPHPHPQRPKHRTRPQKPLV